jgi:hypothetical protein
MVRFLTGCLVLWMTGCTPRLTFNTSEMTPEQMLTRADHVFVGVIQKHQLYSSPYRRLTPEITPESRKYWRILRREVRVEMVLRGTEPRKTIDIYEIFWAGGASGNWNATHDGERDLFLVHVEDGKYHVIRDWWRCIFRVAGGPHSRLPLDETHSLWERIALMNYRVESSAGTVRIGALPFTEADPGGTQSRWRRVKLLRGLVRHPSQNVRIAACRDLILFGNWGQDECCEALSDPDKSQLPTDSAAEVATIRLNASKRDAQWWWVRYRGRDERRLLTAINNQKLRADICRLYMAEYPGDTDSGCPADSPPPATIVTDRGDVPLIGPWPH